MPWRRMKRVTLARSTASGVGDQRTSFTSSILQEGIGLGYLTIARVAGLRRLRRRGRGQAESAGLRAPRIDVGQLGDVGLLEAPAAVGFRPGDQHVLDQVKVLALVRADRELGDAFHLRVLEGGIEFR